MKKIMFNDKYGLTDAVLQGRKTMTRRIIPQLMSDKDFDISEWGINDQGKVYICLYEGGRPTTDIFPAYQPGEVVAVAQSGKEIYNQLQQRYGNTSDAALGFMEMYKGLAMWRNKMFVPADLCPNKICITDIKVERLQDISDEDCIEEGITTMTEGKFEVGNAFGWDTKIDALKRESFFTPRAAFAALIDKFSGKGTWALNPWVFAYTFVLVD